MWGGHKKTGGNMIKLKGIENQEIYIKPCAISYMSPLNKEQKKDVSDKSVKTLIFVEGVPNGLLVEETPQEILALFEKVH